jgi:hypothetical protein
MVPDAIDIVGVIVHFSFQIVLVVVVVARLWSIFW